MPDLPQGEQRWTIWVCPGCGDVDTEANPCGNSPGHPNDDFPPLVETEVVPSSVAAERDRLRGALEFYADVRRYAWETAYGGAENAEEGEGVGCRWTSACAVAEDHGDRARAALASTPEES